MMLVQNPLLRAIAVLLGLGCCILSARGSDEDLYAEHVHRIASLPTGEQIIISRHLLAPGSVPVPKGNENAGSQYEYSVNMVPTHGRPTKLLWSHSVQHTGGGMFTYVNAIAERDDTLCVLFFTANRCFEAVVIHAKGDEPQELCSLGEKRVYVSDDRSEVTTKGSVESGDFEFSLKTLRAGATTKERSFRLQLRDGNYCWLDVTPTEKAATAPSSP